MKAEMQAAGLYAEVNGLKLYYEIHGTGKPLVLLHGGGSTITSSFGYLIPLLAQHFRVIAVELQAHGRTADRAAPLSFEQDADDVAALLEQLGLSSAAVLGFSNGGTTALQCAIRHPELVDKLVLIAALTRRSGMQEGFFEGMQQASLEHMPPLLKEAYLTVCPDMDGLQRMFDRDVERMLAFRDIDDAAIAAVTAPALVINGDREVILAEHALFLARTLQQARLLLLPCAHGEYIGECCSTLDSTLIPDFVAATVREFLQS